jgi:hypothetical protein
VALSPGEPRRFPHARVDARCPRYVRGMVELSAGIGHRTREWTTAFWLALTYNLTFVHNSVDGAVQGSEHGAYAGWDTFMGLTQGEDASHNASALLAAGTRQIFLPNLVKNRRPVWGLPTADVLALWHPVLTNASTACNVIFITRGNEVPHDVSGAVRAHMTWKFAAAEAARAAAAAAANASRALVYAPDVVNVAVHFRVGDQVPTGENVLALLAISTALRPLRAAGVRGEVHVHVHTDGPFALEKLGGRGEFEKDFASLAPLRFFHHATMDAMATLWHFANADVFVGSKSGFSYMVGLLAARPFAVLQLGDENADKNFCADGGVAACCYVWAECDARAPPLIAKAAARIAAAQACGHIAAKTAVTDFSWAAA